jgi:putative spermidine/putrescine transport system permease protein
MTEQAAEYQTAAPQPGARAAVRPWRLMGFAFIIPSLLFLAAFFIAPLWFVGEMSLREGRLPPPGGGLWQNYERLFFDSFYLGVIGETVALSLVVTLACIVLGYPVAYFMVRHAGDKLYNLIVFLLIAPLLTPIIMRTFGWQVLLARRGLVNDWLMSLDIISKPLALLNSPVAVVLGLIHVLAPFMILSVASVLAGIDRRLEESARMLGAGKGKTFLKITLPLSMDGLGTGAILVFMLANGSFVTLLLLGGGSLQTLPLLIYQQFNTTRDLPFAAAMSIALLALALACLYLQMRVIRRKGV